MSRLRFLAPNVTVRDYASSPDMYVSRYAHACPNCSHLHPCDLIQQSSYIDAHYVRCAVDNSTHRVGASIRLLEGDLLIFNTQDGSELAEYATFTLNIESHEGDYA